MSVNKKLLLSFTMAGMMILPMMNRVMDTGVLFLLIPLILFWISVKESGLREFFRARADSFRKIFSFKADGLRKVFQSWSWETVIRRGLYVFFIAAAAMKLAGFWPGGSAGAGEYAAVAAAVLLFPAWKPFGGWERGSLRIPVVIGIWVLALYFLDAALFPGALLLFDGGQDTLVYINMAAFLVILMASGLYTYSMNRAVRLISVAGVAAAALAIAINDAWGTAFVVFAIFVIHSVAIVPVAGIMKRLLQLFFGLALFFSNMCLLVQYSGWIHVEGLEYHLECGVAGELFLCLLAIYVFRRWDRIPPDINLWEIKLIRLQKGCRVFLRAAAGFLVFAALLSLVDGRMRAADLEAENLVRLFAGEKWEGIKSGVFTVTALSLLEHLNEALMQMWQGNVFAVFYRMYGLSGLGAALAGFVLLCRRLYSAAWDKSAAGDLPVWLAAGLMGALVCLPVNVYMLPVYLLPVYMAAYRDDGADL